MIELRLLQERDTTTKPAVLQFRMNPSWRYLGYGLSENEYEQNWGEWTDVPVILKEK